MKCSVEKQVILLNQRFCNLKESILLLLLCYLLPLLFSQVFKDEFNFYVNNKLHFYQFTYIFLMFFFLRFLYLNSFFLYFIKIDRQNEP
jgi:hypothetical protein